MQGIESQVNNFLRNEKKHFVYSTIHTLAAIVLTP